MPKFRQGDLFSMAVAQDKYVCGRIMLDVKEQCVKPNLIEANSPLMTFVEAVLVEVYRDLFAAPDFSQSEVLIPGIFIDKRAITSKEWPIGGREPVNPTEVEFPETLTNISGRAHFRWGEIDLPIKLSSQDLDRIGVYQTEFPSSALPDVCLYYLDLKHLMDHDYAESMHLKNADLRFSEHRDQVYELLHESPNQSYAEMAMRFGHNTSRFYE